MTKDKTLILLSMEKTAGTTLNMIIERQFPKDAIFIFRGLDSENFQKSMDLLQRLSEKERQRIRYVRVQPFFELHKYLPGPCTYVTLVREPVDRVISEFYYEHQRSAYTGKYEVVSKNMSLEDYVRSGLRLSWNGQVRELMGVQEGSWPNYGPFLVSQDGLEIAKANLRQHFTLIGLTEKFNESLILLKRTFGWRTKDILYVKQLVSTIRPTRDKVGSETVKLIEEHNKLDMQLYEFAKQIFKERIRQQGPSFRYELLLFQSCNVFNIIGGHLWNSKLQKVIDFLPALIRGDLQISYIYNKVVSFLKSKKV